MLDTSNLSIIFAEYIDNVIAPQASTWQKLGAYFLSYTINNRMNVILENYSPIMKMAGIMNDNGEIDLNYTYDMMKDVSNKAGKVNILGYNMDSSDIEAIYRIAKRYER